jgi:hypothetical protein
MQVTFHDELSSAARPACSSVASARDSSSEFDADLPEKVEFHAVADGLFGGTYVLPVERGWRIYRWPEVSEHQFGSVACFPVEARFAFPRFSVTGWFRISSPALLLPWRVEARFAFPRFSVTGWFRISSPTFLPKTIQGQPSKELTPQHGQALAPSHARPTRCSYTDGQSKSYEQANEYVS